MNKNVKNLEILKEIVGTEQFNIIVERLTGENIYFNKRVAYPSKEERDEAIRKDFFHGVDVPELVVKYNLKMTSIYRIVESKQ